MPVPTLTIGSVEDAAMVLRSVIFDMLPTLNAGLAAIDAEPFLTDNIINYYSLNLDNDSYPAVIFEENEEKNYAYGLPNIFQSRYDFDLYFLFTHDQPQRRVDIRRRLSALAKFGLMSRQGDYYMPSGSIIQFIGEDQPVGGITYTIDSPTRDGNMLVSGIRVAWSCVSTDLTNLDAAAMTGFLPILRIYKADGVMLLAEYECNALPSVGQNIVYYDPVLDAVQATPLTAQVASVTRNAEDPTRDRYYCYLNV